MHNSSLWTGRKRVPIVWRMSCPLHVKDNAAPDEQQCAWSGRLGIISQPFSLCPIFPVVI
jgi:hypothetical protein